MSSKSEKEKFDDKTDYGILNEEPLDLAQAILSYSNIGKSEEFIYNGTEKILFCNRHPLYRSIFINEFVKLIKRKSKRNFYTHLSF